jgi:3-deoxy-D-manno-octulosonate 8-phosphate phosphatase (KDO 8-P phosphatase)
VDGVLTAGTVEISSRGGESKSFSIRDGLSLVWARRLGLEVGLLSGRPSEATTRRARELGISLVVQGSNDKRAGYAEIVAERGLADEDVAYMGDDLVDLPVLGRVGLSAAPADAVCEVRRAVRWVSSKPGGQGAVRELVELLLKAQGQWDALVRSYQV